MSNKFKNLYSKKSWNWHEIGDKLPLVKGNHGSNFYAMHPTPQNYVQDSVTHYSTQYVHGFIDESGHTVIHYDSRALPSNSYNTYATTNGVEQLLGIYVSWFLRMGLCGIAFESIDRDEVFVIAEGCKYDGRSFSKVVRVHADDFKKRNLGYRDAYKLASTAFDRFITPYITTCCIEALIERAPKEHDSIYRNSPLLKACIKAEVHGIDHVFRNISIINQRLGSYLTGLYNTNIKNAKEAKMAYRRMKRYLFRFFFMAALEKFDQIQSVSSRKVNPSLFIK